MGSKRPGEGTHRDLPGEIQPVRHNVPCNVDHRPLHPRRVLMQPLGSDAYRHVELGHDHADRLVNDGQLGTERSVPVRFTATSR